jgi:hypothetical protein
MRMSVFATALVLGGVGVSAAQAMPMPAVGAQQLSPVVNVAYPCGPGWHLSRYGRCVPNRVYAEPRYYGYYGYRGYRGPPPYAWGPRPYYRPRGWYGPPQW